MAPLSVPLSRDSSTAHPDHEQMWSPPVAVRRRPTRVWQLYESLQPEFQLDDAL